MTNYMAEVAKMFGVKLGEEFIVGNSDYGFDETSIFKFTENGLKNLYFPNTSEKQYSNVFNDLLTGHYSIKCKPWKPRVGEQFYFIDRDGKSCCLTCGYNNSSLNLYKIGNCYRTREAAEADAEKWVQFYASDEVLEV